ncbi:MAG: RES family NAD+ phosphorylase [Pseudomonadales bacterium]|nr:RES family NAD+ phosphorylase [Pseudomonadales bacterium]
MEENKECCPSCFDDRGLNTQVIPTFSKHVGTCSYCASEEVDLVAPDALRDHFETLLSIYVEDDNGATFAECLKNDWHLFTHPRMDVANASILLVDILDEPEIIRRRFSPKNPSSPNGLDLWASFKEELMNVNRFFPKKKMDEALLGKLLSHFVIDPCEESEEWYRARIQETCSPYPPEQMGAPPKNLASQGRANPAGIPYLYLASEKSTAVSEIRPHTGQLASIASFHLREKLQVVDLRNPRKTASPFLISNPTEIAKLRSEIGFLTKLGAELSKPVQSHNAAIDYLPTQYLCEFIKTQTYEGVLYNSSVGNGVNLALFDTQSAQPINVSSQAVSKVSVELGAVEDIAS